VNQGATAPQRPLRIFLVAGEHSGDLLGAGLMGALKARMPDASFMGVGGPAMEAAGLKSLFPLADIAVMGIVPVIRRLPSLVRRIRETADAVVAAAPDALVIIDSPDFTHRVASRVRRRLPRLPIVDYVSPSVWAWRPGRAKKMRAYVDRVLALLPFEPDAHRRLGGPACAYVGHPLIERLGDLRPRAADAARRDASPPLVVVLPGSRRSEIDKLTEVFGAAFGALAQRCGPFDLVLPAVAHLADEIAARTRAWPMPPRIVLGEAEKYAAFRQARCALAASGTVTLELALAQTPMVVAYKFSAVEKLVRPFVKVPSIVLPNLILGRNAIPELLQEECTVENLADSLARIMADGAARATQMQAFQEIASLMQLPDGETPSGRAAEIVLSIIPDSAKR
jgi:lipid-A-disaccharide synthase